MIRTLLPRMPANQPQTQAEATLTEKGFDPKAYWESRLSDEYSLAGVGYSGLGLSYNRWLYRIRKRVFRRTVRGFLVGDPGAARVLDVGSGTGFYIAARDYPGIRRLQPGVLHLDGRLFQRRPG